MTVTQRVAQIFGVLFLLATVSGFMASGMNMDSDVDTAPRAMGLFPVNVLHNIVHLVFGVWGLMAARSFGAARTYARVTGVIYVALVVIGYFIPNGFGLLPLGGNDILLHVVFGVPLVLAGFLSRDPTPPAAAGPTDDVRRMV